MEGPDIPHLLHADEAHVELAHPTQRERIKQLKCNGAAWRGALSLDAYLRREAHLSAQDSTKDGGLTSWVLVDSKDEATRNVLCACETYRKKALVATGGKIHETVAHGIGSVFCPPAFRGNGYAGRLMKEVGERLRTWQTDESSLFSILYSDIGKQFYAKHGWMPFPSAHVSLSPSLRPVQHKLPFTRPLYATDLPKLCAVDEQLIRQSLKTNAADSEHTFVALIPDSQTIQWHHAREEFVGAELFEYPPDIKGAIVGDTEGKRAWCYWTRMWYNHDTTSTEENTLHILRLVVEEKEITDWSRSEVSVEDKTRYALVVAALLERALQQAEEWMCETVELWNPSAITIEAARLLDGNIQVTERDIESICSLRWYGDEQALDKLVWLGNEKYGWC